MLNDVKKDLEATRKLAKETDDARIVLQEEFDVTAEKVREDTVMKKQFQENLIQEITQLKEELQKRARIASQREQEHIDQLAQERT